MWVEVAAQVCGYFRPGHHQLTGLHYLATDLLALVVECTARTDRDRVRVFDDAHSQSDDALAEGEASADGLGDGSRDDVAEVICLG